MGYGGCENPKGYLRLAAPQSEQTHEHTRKHTHTSDGCGGWRSVRCRRARLTCVTTRCVHCLRCVAQAAGLGLCRLSLQDNRLPCAAMVGRVCVSSGRRQRACVPDRSDQRLSKASLPYSGYSGVIRGLFEICRPTAPRPPPTPPCIKQADADGTCLIIYTTAGRARGRAGRRAMSRAVTPRPPQPSHCHRPLLSPFSRRLHTVTRHAHHPRQLGP